MKEILERRLGELQEELQSGQSMLSELDRKRAELRSLLLRIDGAIEVVNELLKEPAEAETSPASNVTSRVA
jgi:prefoldin subunit 5